MYATEDTLKYTNNAELLQANKLHLLLTAVSRYAECLCNRPPMKSMMSHSAI